MNLELLCKQTGQLMRDVGLFIEASLGKVEGDAIEHKSLNSLVSYVDKTAESKLVTGCLTLLPEAGFITEEETIASSAEKDWRWIIDPLDGTTNFLHQIPFFSISVALQYKSETVIGLVYEVNRDELFYAWKGAGAYLNKYPIRVGESQKLEDTLVATGFPYYDFEKTEAYLKMLGQLMKGTRGIRRLGSAALDLAYVACGRFEGYFEYSLAPWDVAAGAFIVQEAGGKVGDFAGGNDYLFGKEIVAGNPEIYEALVKLCKENFK